MAGLLAALTTSLLPLFLAAPLLITLYRNTFTSRSSLNKIPGPFLARFSNIWRFCMVWRGHAEQEVLHLHKRYGKLVRLGPNCVSVGDVNMIKTVYPTKNIWNKSDMYGTADFIQGGIRYQTLFSTRNEDLHKNMIRPIARLYTMTNVASHEDLVSSTLQRFMEQLDKRFCASGEICQMDKWLHYFAWDVLGEVTFSETFGFLEQGADVMNLIKTNDGIMDYFGKMASMPFLDSFLDKNPDHSIGPPSATNASTFAATKLFARLADTTTSTSTTLQNDFLDRFIALKQQYSALDDAALISYLTMNLIAGSDTTAIELRAALYYILRDARVHAALRAELDASGLPHALPARWAPARALPYLEAVLRETLRMHPAVGLALERVVPGGGAVVAGVVLPEGTTVGVNPWVAARDADTFGERVDSFVPERWLRREGEATQAFEARRAAMEAADMSFGVGVRACYGKPLALLECYKTLATLFAAYDMTLVDPEKEWETKNNFFVTQYGLDVKLSRR